MSALGLAVEARKAWGLVYCMRTSFKCDPTKQIITNAREITCLKALFISSTNTHITEILPILVTVHTCGTLTKFWTFRYFCLFHFAVFSSFVLLDFPTWVFFTIVGLLGGSGHGA